MPRLEISAVQTQSAYTVDYGGFPVAGYRGSDGRMYNNPLHPTSLPPNLFLKGRYVTGYILPLNIGVASSNDTTNYRSGFGFRFLYNPASVATAVTIDNTQNIDTTIQVASVVSTQTMSFQLFLNRIPDVADKTLPVANGTLHDIDYLYRVLNGAPIDIGDGVMSSDYGYLLPNPCKVVLGKGLIFNGFANSVSITHQMFQKNMVPVLTAVDLTFQRVFGGGYANGGGASGAGNSGQSGLSTDGGLGPTRGSVLNTGLPGGGGYYVGPGGVIMRNN